MRKLQLSASLLAFLDELEYIEAALSADDETKDLAERTTSTSSNDVEEWKEGVNALRLTTYAELLKIAAEKGYGRAWADSFFPADAGAPDEPAAPEVPATPEVPAKPETP
jgi:hypothetical protein